LGKGFEESKSRSRLRERVWDEPAQEVGEVGVELFW
jgi:hypothetical protein